MKKILIYFLLIFCTLSHLQSYPQGKEANIWYFGRFAGIDFNEGSPPVALLNSQMFAGGSNVSGCASIADSNGNLLFYSDGVDIWNKNHVFMQNGQNVGCRSSQGSIIVPKPNNNHLYYFFNYIWDVNAWQNHFQYSLIDMNLDNGNGGVVASQKGVRLFNNANFHLSAVSHANGSDVWVLAHKYYSDYYYAYLVTGDSLHHTPEISQAGSVFDVSTGYMKISPNGKKVASVIDLSGFFDLVDFDNETGMVNDENLVHNTGDYYGVEFSPDNSKLYFNGLNELFQYNLNAGNPQAILESEVVIFYGGWRGALQLAPDGKIYCSMGGPYLSVIHQPNNAGVFCDFEHDAINLEGRLTTGGLPSFIQSYLNDPTFTTQNNCVGDTTIFEITETNGIDSVFWHFNDFPNFPYDTSTLFNPSYTFSHADTFEVSLTVYSGLLEKTVTQEVIIHPLPEPNLGPDTTICSGQEIVLDAECGPHFYSWSTGDWGVSQITVSDSGWYWVRVQSEAGCIAFDSIYIGYYPPAIVDTQNLEIIPTTCGGSMGVIRGLTVSGNPPFQYQWVDDLGNPIANTIDIFHLPVGNYTLQVTDGNGCLTEFGPYTIYDAGDVLIEDVNYTQEHCGQQDASIIVTAISGLSDMLFYSIDNGANYYTNQGIFTGLSAGTYAVRVKDSTDCQDVYINNPIILESIAGPQVTDVQITPASNGQNNGAINIIASGNSDTLFYSNDNGANFQINDGLFTNLFPGYYTCIVMDEFDCDTTFIVEVTEDITIHLEAIAGDDEVCPGNAAYVPLIVNQFNDVAIFRATLLFNKNLLECKTCWNARVLPMPIRNWKIHWKPCYSPQKEE
jgi:PKD repeat protein